MLKKLFKKKTVQSPPPKADLVFCFEYEGKKYYQWPDPLNMPIQRVTQNLFFSLELSLGMSTEHLNKLINMAEVNILSGKKEGYIKAVGCLHEMKVRQNQIAPISIYYNQFAVSYIREDEDPLIYNEQVQKEKVEVFAKASQEQGSFFFQLPEFKQLCELSNIFSENWQSLINLSQQAQRRNETAENILKPDE